MGTDTHARNDSRRGENLPAVPVERRDSWPRRGMSRQHGYGWVSLLWPLAGLASLVWFFVRVVPKPSRAAYPCQRVAAPVACGFVVWLAGLLGSALACRRAMALRAQSRYLLASIFTIAAVAIIWFALGATGGKPAAAVFIPSDLPNTPIGVGKGIHRGRVVWVYEPNVTQWDGRSGNWWDDENTDQDLVDQMVSQALRSLTGTPSDTAAWDALFRSFNGAMGENNRGYQRGEKIAIKINMNQDSSTDRPWRQDAGMPSPQVVHALLSQLIHAAGVPGGDITIYDATKYIGDPIYNKIRAEPDPNFQAVRFVVVPWMAGRGREGAVIDTQAFVQFAVLGVGNVSRAYVPQCVAQAKYLINLALLRAHDTFGVTLTAKNHFGSIRFPAGPWGPGPLHYTGSRNVPMGTASCLVDLIGSKHLGGKTLLYMLDALYPAADNSDGVIRFESFGNDWCSSLFISQDPVALDSVGLDFLRNEPESLYVQRSQGLDNYLHEAALAYDPPSKTVYNPDGGEVPLPSLGVHEHWNNPVDKQYSRNLGLEDGIELIPLWSLAHGVK